MPETNITDALARAMLAPDPPLAQRITDELAILLAEARSWTEDAADRFAEALEELELIAYETG